MLSASRALLLVLSYLLIVTIVGPKLMQNRKPYKLKRIIIVYNTFQVVVCTILFLWVRTETRIDDRYKYVLLTCHVDYTHPVFFLRPRYRVFFFKILIIIRVIWIINRIIVVRWYVKRCLVSDTSRWTHMGLRTAVKAFYRRDDNRKINLINNTVRVFLKSFRAGLMSTRKSIGISFTGEELFIRDRGIISVEKSSF